MDMPCGKYLVVMLGLWLPLLAAAGDLDRPFATEAALAELRAMSAATVDRYLKPARDRMRIKGISTTKPSALLRNSIAIRTCTDETPERPGVIEADTVAHCGPTLIGEFARTLTMTDVVTGWTENHSIRNNASKWIVEAIEGHCHIIRNVLQPRRVRACLPESGWGGVRIRQRCRVWRHRAIERIGLSSGFATRWH